MSKNQKPGELYARDDAGLLKPGHFQTPELAALRYHQMILTELISGARVTFNVYGEDVVNSCAHLAVHLRYTDPKLKPVRDAMEHVLISDMVERLCNTFKGKDIEVVGVCCGGVVNDYRNKETFVVTDIYVDSTVLPLVTTHQITKQLGLISAPVVGSGDFNAMSATCLSDFDSKVGKCKAAGIVARPEVDFYTKAGERIMATLKCADIQLVKGLMEKELGHRPAITLRTGEPPREVGRLDFVKDEKGELSLSFTGNTIDSATVLFDTVLKSYNNWPADKTTAMKAQILLSDYIAGPTPDRVRNAQWYANALIDVARVLAGPQYVKWAGMTRNWPELEALALGTDFVDDKSRNLQAH